MQAGTQWRATLAGLFPEPISSLCLQILWASYLHKKKQIQCRDLYSRLLFEKASNSVFSHISRWKCSSWRNGGGGKSMTPHCSYKQLIYSVSNYIHNSKEVAAFWHYAIHQLFSVYWLMRYCTSYTTVLLKTWYGSPAGKWFKNELFLFNKKKVQDV